MADVTFVQTLLRGRTRRKLGCLALCACLAVALASWWYPAAPAENPPLVWTSQELGMHRAFGLHVRHLLERSSTCVPNGTSIISVTNPFFANLTALQMAIMPRCMQPRTALYCSQSLASMREAQSFRKHCFWPGQELAASAYRQGEYMKLIWLKWRLITQATKFGGAALFIDADVVVMRNPFPVLEHISTPLAMQRESYGNPFAFNRNHVNGGMVWLRSHALALELEKLRTRGRELDQNAVQRYLDEQSPPVHSLLPVEFAGHCWARWHFSTPSSWAHFVAYHAHCIETPQEKLEALEKRIEARRREGTGGGSRSSRPAEATSQRLMQLQLGNATPPAARGPGRFVRV